MSIKTCYFSMYISLIKSEKHVHKENVDVKALIGRVGQIHKSLSAFLLPGEILYENRGQSQSFCCWRAK